MSPERTTKFDSSFRTPYSWRQSKFWCTLCLKSASNNTSGLKTLNPSTYQRKLTLQSLVTDAIFQVRPYFQLSLPVCVNSTTNPRLEVDVEALIIVYVSFVLANNEHVDE